MILEELINGLDYRVNGSVGVEVTGIHYDSRSVEAGGLFVAVAGEKADGYDFIDAAVKRGASCIVIEREEDKDGGKSDLTPDVPIFFGVTTVTVENTREALSALSSRFYGSPSESLVLIGITGTNGKTTVAYIVESILEEAGFSVGVIGTINYRYAGKTVAATHTTPGPVTLHRILKEMVDAGITHCVMEVSSHALEQKRVDGCRFSATVFTNLTHEHLDYHKNMEEYFQAKSLLFSLLKNSESLKDGGKARAVTDPVINIDDVWGRRLYGELPFSLTYGLDAGAQMRPVEYSLERDGIRALVETKRGSVEIVSALIGEYNLYNIMAAASVAYSLGVECSAIERGIKALKKIPGRLERVLLPGTGFSAYVDYAHTSDALERVLIELKRITTTGRLITVFGCGGDRDHAKRAEMARMAARYSDVSIVTTDNPRDESPGAIIEMVVAGMEGIKRVEQKSVPAGGEKYFMVIEDRREAIRHAVTLANTPDTLLVAGKGHEDYQIIKSRRLHFDDVEELKAAVTELTVQASGAP